MITKLKINDLKDMPLSWWADLKPLNTFTEFNFTSDLNIILGPNRSGKSTILKLIRKHLFCEGGAYSKLSNSTKRSLLKDWLSDDPDLYKGYTLDHDGQMLFCFDSSESAGLESGSFNADYFMDGVSSIFANKDSSSGEAMLNRFSQVIKHILEQEKAWYSEANLEDPVYKQTLKPTILKNKRTILLDEPTINMDLDTEILFFKQLPNLAKKMQVIITSHSPLAFQKYKCDVNYIELVPDYLDNIRQKYRKLKF